MTTQEGNNAVVARHLEALANAAKDYTLAELATVNDDKLILPTVASTVDGGLWLDVSGDTPVPMFYYGGETYTLGGSSSIVTPSHGGYSSEYLVAYLPFDTSPTYDTCGNTWASYGDQPVISNAQVKFGTSALYLNGHSALGLDDGITLGGQDFTVDGWFYSIGDHFYGRFFEISTANRQDGRNFNARNGDSVNNVYFKSYNTGLSSTNQWLHLAVTYSATAEELYHFVNGVLCQTRSITIDRHAYDYAYISRSNYFDESYSDAFEGYVQHFRIHDGVALWTQDFTPPTASDYD